MFFLSILVKKAVALPASQPIHEVVAKREETARLMTNITGGQQKHAMFKEQSHEKELNDYILVYNKPMLKDSECKFFLYFYRKDKEQ